MTTVMIYEQCCITFFPLNESPSREGKPKCSKKQTQILKQRENLGCNASIKIYHSSPHSKTKATSQQQDIESVIKKFNFEILPTWNKHQSQTTCSKKEQIKDALNEKC